jgi:hypothetical protein
MVATFIYFTTLAVAETIFCPSMGQLLSSESVGMWKEAPGGTPGKVPGYLVSGPANRLCIQRALCPNIKC